MKIRGLALAAALVLSSIGGVPAAASPDGRHDGQAMRGDNGRHEGWRDHDDRGRHLGWRNHHRRHKVCRTVWRHHHRQRVCSWRWR